MPWRWNQGNPRNAANFNNVINRNGATTNFNNIIINKGSPVNGPVGSWSGTPPRWGAKGMLAPFAIILKCVAGMVRWGSWMNNIPLLFWTCISRWAWSNSALSMLHWLKIVRLLLPHFPDWNLTLWNAKFGKLPHKMKLQECRKTRAIWYDVKNLMRRDVAQSNSYVVTCDEASLLLMLQVPGHLYHNLDSVTIIEATWSLASCLARIKSWPDNPTS